MEGRARDKGEERGPRQYQTLRFIDEQSSSGPKERAWRALLGLEPLFYHTSHHSYVCVCLTLTCHADWRR